MRNLFRFLLSICLVILLSWRILQAQEIVDQWQFTLQSPESNWTQENFDDSKWDTGHGGFGVRSTPGSRVATRWETNDIWLRKFIELDVIPNNAALLIHYDEDAEVYLNGKQVLSVAGYLVEYRTFKLDDEAVKQLRVGKNCMAVHCRQTGGGQFIDVHLVDAEKIPELPPPMRSTKPFISELITTWGESLTPSDVWTEYPRPQLQRNEWQNLNGHWNYTVTANDVITTPKEWTEKIVVPFCLESKLGGAQRLLTDKEALWYQRSFSFKPQTNKRALLHFEAVDYECVVFVNGKRVGTHKGGNTPFTFDISDAVKNGENKLVVRVEDATDGYQLRGKQVVDAGGIFYTQVSGIWQTVWLESVPQSYIEDLKITTDAFSNEIRIATNVDGKSEGYQVHVVVRESSDALPQSLAANFFASKSIVAESTGSMESVVIKIPDAKLWSPDSPNLYGLEIRLINAQGKTVDQVTSYAGIRSVGKKKDNDGHWRMTLNDQFIFHWGPLDQGWWPDGLLTPPSDDAMLFDVEFLKSAGFNMIRKHIKVEPSRYYYHCDRLGMMLWQDQVSSLMNPPWTRLELNPTDADWPDSAHQQYMLELERMVDHLENQPSIVMWVPFNEAWGQHRTMEVGKWMVERDPNRLVNIASGGNFWPVGDIVDEHAYPDPAFPFNQERYGNFIKVVGEFGGHGWAVPDHLWDVNKDNWGYGGLPKTEAEYRERYANSLQKLLELKKQGIAAGVYTQTTDVEGEVNGLMTYDRKVIKIPADSLRKLHAPLLKPIQSN